MAMDTLELNSQYRQYSIKLWPPSLNTRHMLVRRIAGNLTTKSIFTQKFGTLDREEEALEKAKGIEDASFAIASLHYEYYPDGDGSYAIRLYVKECSKLLLEVLKSIPIKKDDSIIHESVFDVSNGQDDEDEADEGEARIRKAELESKMKNLRVN